MNYFKHVSNTYINIRVLIYIYFENNNKLFFIVKNK